MKNIFFLIFLFLKKMSYFFLSILKADLAVHIETYYTKYILDKEHFFCEIANESSYDSDKAYRDCVYECGDDSCKDQPYPYNNNIDKNDPIQAFRKDRYNL